MRSEKLACIVALALLLLCAASSAATTRPGTSTGTATTRPAAAHAVPARAVNADVTAAPATAAPESRSRRALIISVDGLRPDVLLRADAPNITRLYRGGTYTFWAKTTAASITLPTHVSMLTGVTPETHAIHWNGDMPLSKPLYPRATTLFELAKSRGLSTAMVAGKSKMSVVDKPGSIDYAYFPASPKASDDDVASHAVTILRDRMPDVTFVHLPGVDNAGHKFGWATPQQFDAVRVADRCVGQMLDVLDERQIRDSTLIILTADHGGAGRTHGPDDPRSRHVPWIVAGPGVRADYDLTRSPDTTVEIYDTFTTVCHMLGIPVRGKVRGRFVEEILSERELLVGPYESMQPTTNPTEPSS